MLLSVVDASVLVTCEAVTPPAQPSPGLLSGDETTSPAQPSPAQPSPAQPTLSLTARRGMPAGKPPRRRLELEPALERTQHPDTRAVATCDTNLLERVNRRCFKKFHSILGRRRPLQAPTSPFWLFGVAFSRHCEIS